MATTPVIAFKFDEGVADPTVTTVVNTGSSGATQNGTLVGAHETSDFNAYCEMTEFEQDYGLVPRCKPVATETLCLARHTDLGVPGG